MAADASELGRKIIEINRKVRLGSTTPQEWEDRLKALLRAQPDLQGPIEVRDVRPLQGGAGSSSGTLFFEAVIPNVTGPEGRSYVLRFTPAEQLFHTYDLDGQVRIQRAMLESGVPVPKQCWEDIPGTYLGVPGYIMERALGEAAPSAWFSEGLIFDAEPADRRHIVMSFVRTLAHIHAVDWRGKGLSFLLNRAKAENLIGREINWYWDGLAWAGETEAIARYGAIRDWLLANAPAYDQAVLCHGDANFTNNLFHDNQVSAVLDWEMAFIGTPECDLTYAILGMSSLTSDFPEGVPSPEEMLSEYEQFSGRRLQHMDYYRLFTLYRIVCTHILGMRAFPDDFRTAFADYVDSLIARMNDQARLLGVF